jgi:O-antigen ligase
LAAHNTLLQIFAETGIPGGVFFTLFCLIPLFEIRKFQKKNKYSDRIGVLEYKLLTIAFTGFWVCAIFGNRVEFYILYVLIALMVAIKVNILNDNRENEYAA